jgi:hypothetical protein
VHPIEYSAWKIIYNHENEGQKQSACTYGRREHSVFNIVLLNWCLLQITMHMHHNMQNNIYSQNPYWAAYQFSTDNVKDRVLGSGSIKFDILDWLYVQGRLGMDFYVNRVTTIEPYGTKDL